MRGLVLSLFSGLGMLDEGFREQGFCVVSAGDICWGPLWDIRKFHPPAGVFDGVIGGPPCQQHSSARGGKAAREPDMTDEFVRIVKEAEPTDFWVMENVPSCPPPAGLPSRRLVLDNRWLGEKQSRRRVFYSDLPLCVAGSVFEHPDSRPCAATSYWKDGRQYGDKTAKRFLEVVEDQGLPEGFDLPWFTVAGKVQAVCNGVPLPMARAVARAVVKALEREAA